MSISDDEVEAALHERIPGGSEVWHWIAGGGMQIEDIHREVMSAALRAAAKVRAIREGDGEWVRASCPGCNGTGDQGGNPSYGVCDDCEGSGKVRQPIPATGGEKE